MYSLWKHYDPEAARYEHSLPPAYPWNRDYAAEGVRYVRGDDGYWYDPHAVESEVALLSCTGDLMCEPRMTNAHRYGDAYFFHPLFRYVRDVLRRSDFCIANLETTLTDQTPYAGDYHCIAGRYHCNAPRCYLDAVRYAGFDALVTANNHNCDSGVSGLWDTIRALDEARFMHTGSFLPREEERILLVKVCGIRIAVLSYGNRYNGLDEEHYTEAGLTECLNWFSTEKCKRDVAVAREKGAEFILCYQHWGRDYDKVPNEQQQRILSEMAECGVDYIVGSHTHCLQAHHVAECGGKRVPMMWSMGNFVTNERRELCKHTGILQLTLRRQNGGIAVEEHLIPCYVFDEFGTGRFSVVPTDTTVNGGYPHPRMSGINEYVRARVGDELAFLPDRSLTLADLCQAMNVPLTVPDRAVTGLSVQSGTVRHGHVFFAFGELTLPDRRRLIAADVAAVVTTEPNENFPCLIVSDVAAAYRAAHAVYRPWGDTLHTVLVAGHTGKTTTRELIARTLRAKARVLTVQDAEHIDTAPWHLAHPSHGFAVLELRNDHPLGVREAAALMRPDTLVLTAAPCDAAALADGLAAGGTLWYNGTDAELTAVVTALTRTDITCRPYGEHTLPCPALTFATEQVCTAAAAAVGAAHGVAPERVAAAIGSYTRGGYTQTVREADGVTLVAHLNCKTPVEPAATLQAATGTGRRLAVTTPAFADTVSPWAERLITVSEEHPLAEAETTLLAELREGDTLLLCGEREARLSELLRRLFGLTDGFLPGAS